MKFKLVLGACLCIMVLSACSSNDFSASVSNNEGNVYSNLYTECVSEKSECAKVFKCDISSDTGTALSEAETMMDVSNSLLFDIERTLS